MVTNKINKMADGGVYDELTKIRLKLLEQKIRQQSSENRNSSGRLYPSINSAQQLLQVETLKSQQLLQTVKEERELQRRQTRKNTVIQKDDHMKELMTMMMAQNMQLQQVMLQQVIASTTSLRGQHPIESTMPMSLPKSLMRTPEIEQVGHREMTPFTTLPNNRTVERANPVLPPAKPKQPSTHLKLSPKPQVTRGIATPVRSTERVPDVAKRPRTSIKPEGFLNEVIRNEAQVDSYPFPGSPRVRKLRHIGYVAWACFILISHLKRTAQKRLDAIEQLQALINQAIEELHRRHYLNADGSIRLTLEDGIKEDAFDLKIKNPGVFQKLSQTAQATLTELSSMVETVVYSLTQIKPLAGPLSPTKEGALWHMTQSGILLPPSYLWQVEKENITFTDRGYVTKTNSQTSILLLLGLFISRGLVLSVLLNPAECGLVEGQPSNLASSNLKVLGSIFMKLVRDVTALQLKKKTLPLPPEVSSQLLSDDEMKFVYKKLDKTLIWCKANLKKWAEAHVDSVNRS